MFDNLSDKLARVFKNMRGEGRLSAENMESAQMFANIIFAVLMAFVINGAVSFAEARGKRGFQ